MSQETQEPKGKPDKKFEIFIDKQKFPVTVDSMTAEELRALPDPDIGPDRDLYVEVPGEDDEPVTAGETVTLRNGLHFFTAPARITPGHAAS